MPSKKSVSVNKRLLSRNLAMRLEERMNECIAGEGVEEPGARGVGDGDGSGVGPVERVPTSLPDFMRPPPASSRGRVTITEPLVAMPPGERARLPMGGVGVRGGKTVPVRLGVTQEGGSIVHCLLRATYPPYETWSVERRIRKVQQFRDDLAAGFEGYYLRLDQSRELWGSLSACQRELAVSEGVFRLEFLDYIGRLINKNLVVLDIDHQTSVLRPKARVYGRRSPRSRTTSPPARTSGTITRTIAEGGEHDRSPTFIFLIHLRGGRYELFCLEDETEGNLYTLFQDPHPVIDALVSGGV